MMVNEILGGVVLSFLGIFFIKNWIKNLLILFIFSLTGLSTLYSMKIMALDYMFVDNISLNLNILVIWITMLMIFSSFGSLKKKDYFLEYSIFMMFLLTILLISFFVNDMFSFYFFFEASIIPTMIIIMGWGYQPERFQASIYFFFYTLMGSLPLLLLIIYMNVQMGSSFISLSAKEIFFESSAMGLFMSIFGLLAFMVKMPMFFTHLWLPKAHVEAPVAGSMVLAGVLLKLGGYGALRILNILNLKISLMVKHLFFGISLFGMVVVGALCCRVNDFKALVAYSSVAHMAMVIMGLMTFTKWGFLGSFMMMLAHGLSSSGLFCIVNMYYERTGSRSFYFNKGLISMFPIFSLLIFMLCAANIAAPPTMNLLSEIVLMISIMKLDYLMLLFFPLGSFLGAVFTLFMFSYSQHGGIYRAVMSFSLMSEREAHLLILHILPLNYLFLNPGLFLEINI